jgi:hypothetical protein
VTAQNGYQPQGNVIVTEDNVIVAKGDEVYNYYDMWPGRIATDPDDQGWFFVQPINGFKEHTGRGQALLNGQRICSIKFARERGFRMLPTDNA